MTLPTNAADGDRILRKQVEVRAPLADVWNAWTTAEGLKFISAESRVELRIGGPYEWFLDLPPDPPTVREALVGFARAVLAGAPMPIPLQEGARAVAMAEACLRASETGGRVSVDPVF